MSRGKSWTQEEEEYLQDNYGLKPDEVLAKHLKRTVCAVRQHAYRLQLTRTSQFYTANMVAGIFGVSMSTVKFWIDQGKLKAVKSAAVKSGNHAVWKITEQNITKFVKASTDTYDPRRIDRITNPYWRNLADRATGKDFIPKYKGHWTPQEDAFILNHRNKMSQKDLGKAIKRTEEAVHARLVWLRAKGELVNYKRQSKTRLQNGSYTGLRVWTEEEDQYLKENWGRPRRPDEKGWGNKITCAEVAAHLKRTEQATWTRATRLGLGNKYRQGKREKLA